MKSFTHSNKKALCIAAFVPLVILVLVVTLITDNAPAGRNVLAKDTWLENQTYEIRATSDYTYTVYLPMIAKSYPLPYDPQTLLVAFNTETNTDFASILATLYGATSVEQLPDTSIYRWQFPPGTDVLEMQQLINNDPEIRYVEPDYRVELFETVPNDPRYNEQWALARVQASRAWDISTGSNEVVIAIVDTGIDLGHPDLANKLTDSSTWYDFGDGDNDPRDTYGHGTQIGRAHV